MVQQGQKIWFDGKIQDRKDADQISVLTHSLHYGVGAFEGIRAYRRARGETCIFRLREHITRLFDSCKLVRLVPNVTLDQVCQGCIDLLRADGMQEGYLRPLIMYGAGTMGVLPADNPVQTFIVAWTWGAYLGADALEQGIRCKTSPFARHHIGSGFARGKLTGQYINSVMAKQDAKWSGFDEALLSDVHGHLCEGTGENLFVVRGGRISTPALGTSVLAGITRDTIITLAREEGIGLVETDLTRDEVYLADEVFLTGTAAEVTPVREVDHRPIGQGSRGAITRRLQERYFDLVKGGDDSHPEWLTRV
jgi:branched-chain amino acid aminotransferase